MRRIAGVAVCLALAATPAATQESVQVTVRGFAYLPANLIVARGTQVVWTNKDDTPHTVTATDRGFHSPPLDTGDTFAHTFDRSGRYQYVCTLHPQMTGTVEVKP